MVEDLATFFEPSQVGRIILDMATHRTPFEYYKQEEIPLDDARGQRRSLLDLTMRYFMSCIPDPTAWHWRVRQLRLDLL